MTRTNDYFYKKYNDMARKLWCIPKNDTLVKQVANKYELSRDDAWTIINNAREADSTLADDKITFQEMDNSEAFKNALADYSREYLSVEKDNPLLQEAPDIKRTISDNKQELRDLFSLEMSDEEVEEMMSRRQQILNNTRASKISTADMASLLKAFPDPRRLDFLGDWFCHSICYHLTEVATDQEVRDAYNLPTLPERRDYLINPDTSRIILALTAQDLKDAREDLIADGKTQLADELTATLKNYKTLMFMYGGSLFRDEGIAVNMSGGMTLEDLDPSSESRNEMGEEGQREDDPEDGEKPVNSFSASDQNKSVSSKIVPGIKHMLSSLVEKTRGGEDKLDKFGFGLFTFVPTHLAVNKRLTICRGCTTYDEMIKRLERNRKGTPWINDILSALDTKDKFDVTGTIRTSTSKKEQLQTMFFQSFRKQFTRFRNTFRRYDDDGNMYFDTRDANLNHKYESIVGRARTLFSIREGIKKSENGKEIIGNGARIFKDGKLDSEALSDVRKELELGKSGTVDQQIAKAYQEYQLEIAERNSAWIEDGEEFQYVNTYRSIEEAEEHLRDILNASLGVRASKDMFDDYLSNVLPGQEDQPINAGEDRELNQRFNRLKELFSYTKLLTGALKTWVESAKDAPISNPFYRKRNEEGGQEASAVRNWYNNIAEKLAQFSPDSFESSFYMNKKHYYSWNNPSSAQSIVEMMTSSEKKKREDYIRKKYCKDEMWFLKPGSTAKNPRFYSEWLQELWDGAGVYKGGSPSLPIFQYAEKPAFCAIEYNDQSEMHYSLNVLNDYFNNRLEGNELKRDRGWYRMLIAGDKPRYAQIYGKRYGSDFNKEKDYHSVIARQAVDFFSQELVRAHNVMQRALRNDIKKIDGYDIRVSGDTDAKSEKIRNVIEKMKNKKAVTFRDLIVDGRYIFRETGASFFLNKFLNKEIEKNSELGKYIIKRMFNAGLSNEDLQVVETGIVSTFKDAFHEYMRSIKENDIDYFKRIGLFETRAEKVLENGETYSVQHLKYLNGCIQQWHKEEGLNMYERDDDQLEEASEKFGIELQENGSSNQALKEAIQFDEDLENFVYNNWLAKANMSQIFDVDLAFYGNTPNFQKRNAQVVSSGYASDPDASIHNKKVSDGKYRSITIKTSKVKSNYIDNI